ncbi:hypothetical protein SDC9_66535 [bioreactor metagenome]|uniref:Serpin domain-containing protein n=1 Tax=bioreactor metagenome TaxID=1076179 RepID=A0A644XV64_9ZZZZ|nr:serpin family protein [Oscillospiraceae bacterium]
MKIKSIYFRLGAAVLSALLALSFVSCVQQASAADLMSGITVGRSSGIAADDEFISAAAGFSLDLAKIIISGEENAMVSPVSVYLALAMTANGAAGKTRAEMEKAFGMDLDKLNEYLCAYSAWLTPGVSQLKSANSIWFRDDSDRLYVEPDFLKTNARYYSAAAYKAPFDSSTLKAINAWVSKNTDGMIDKLIDEIDGNSIMYLINAVAFEAKWQHKYETEDIEKGIFTAISGDSREADMMKSTENLYISAKNATGFIKPYADGKYGFAALLPEVGTTPAALLASLDGDSFVSMIKSAENSSVASIMPAFKSEYGTNLISAFSQLGIKDALNSGTADFSKLGKSTVGNIFIGDAIQKTFISVDSEGTKAGAATEIEMRNGCAQIPEYEHSVILDRPFIYAIVDMNTGMPIFIGVLTDIS